MNGTGFSRFPNANRQAVPGHGLGPKIEKNRQADTNAVLCRGDFRRLNAGLFNHRQTFYQIRQGGLRRIPNHIKVNVKITMGDAVAHTAHIAPGDFGVKFNKFRALIHQFGRGFADDVRLSDDRLLCPLVSQKVLPAKSLDEAASIRRRFPQRAKIIRQATFAHKGRASARICSRNFAGKSSGVSKSTDTPSNSSSSICKPPRSNVSSQPPRRPGAFFNRLADSA